MQTLLLKNPNPIISCSSTLPCYQSVCQDVFLMLFFNYAVMLKGKTLRAVFSPKFQLRFVHPLGVFLGVVEWVAKNRFYFVGVMQGAKVC